MASQIETYMNNAHSRILDNLVDVMADLNKEEILSHDDKIDEWLSIWKNEILNRILSAMIEVKKEME